MTDISPTEHGVDNTVGDEQTSLPTETTGQSADEHNQDTGSGAGNNEASQDSDQTSDGRQHDTTQNDGSDDDGLARFAKSQGFSDFASLSDDTKRALKLAHDNQKAFRKTQQDTKEHLSEAVDEVHTAPQAGEDEDEDLAWRKQQTAAINQLAASQKVATFYSKNPDAKDYDKEMAEIVTEEAKDYGPQAAQMLLRNLPRLLVLAKARRGDNDPDAAREAGRREEREILRHKQEASSDSGHASQSTATSGTKVTREWIQNSYDPSNPEHVKMVDEALAAGQL
jgi:hypothetical protein